MTPQGHSGSGGTRGQRGSCCLHTGTLHIPTATPKVLQGQGCPGDTKRCHIAPQPCPLSSPSAPCPHPAAH